ncbi:hypothetical protein SAMN05443637_12066 [Pseudonocardia thermophila]|uniref:Uncharacterized protein n=1 Tax=Pseudonocardia thermophila TaxID=1848 RepID=A0A1M6YJN2_PSETH|nr:hypothetical protein SAMN05443637_12066 [Pseudonocardia thermophila]
MPGMPRGENSSANSTHTTMTHSTASGETQRWWPRSVHSPAANARPRRIRSRIGIPYPTCSAITAIEALAG